MDPQAMQFGPCLPCILQQIWEAEPQDGPVYLSKWDISDAFQCCVLRPADVVAFSYVVPTFPSDTAIYVCVDLFLPMGWLSPPTFFCAASETAADHANTYLADHCLPTPEYGPTLRTYSTAAPPRFCRAVAGNGRLHGKPELPCTEESRPAAPRHRDGPTRHQGHLSFSPPRTEGLCELEERSEG